jgi:tripartite ATP-independent transporter DctM subunit
MLLRTAPVAFAMGVAATLGLLLTDAAPLLVVPQRIFAGADSFVLLAIPLFILAGALMETGGISARLVDLARVMVGHVRGGLGMAVVVAEMFFSGISGSTVADVSAIGALMIPSLIRIGFKPDRAVAIVSAASAMGILIPPCLIMVIIAQIAGVSVGALFLAGFIPAAVLAVALMILIYVQARLEGIGGDERASWAECGRAFVRAVVPLMMPVIIFGAILSGVADPTEAAVLAVAYAFVVGVFVYKEIRWHQLPKILIDSAITSGVVIFMVGAASSFSWILAFEQVPVKLANLMLGASSSPMVFYILSITIFTILAAVLEGLPAIIICLPIFLPIAAKFNIDPLHYSIVVVAATGLGLFLPPIGIGLYIASSFAKLTADQTFRAMLPYTAVLAFGILLLMLFPWLTLIVPRLTFG